MKKFQIILAVLAAVCVVSVGVSTLVIGVMAGTLQSQNAASRWSGDGTPMAQVSAFLSPVASLSSETLERSFVSSMDSAFKEASISPADTDARIYAYAYSAETDVTLSRTGEYGKTLTSGVSATAAACGGDYFLFHPLRMLSGYYFDTDDVLNDCVVIDEDLAWQFFGSPDVVGQLLHINGRDCYVSGVCQRGGSSDEAEFYGTYPRIYISYSLAEELFGAFPVSTVEAVMPDPVSGFAMNIFKKSLKADESLCEFVENSRRFSDDALRERLFGVSERGVRTKPIAYPYFENTAIKLSDSAAAVYIFKLIPIIILVLILFCELVIIYIKRRCIFRFFKGHILRIVRDIKQNIREAKSKKSKSLEKGEDL